MTANHTPKRFHLALVIWICGSLLGFALSYAGVFDADLEASVYSFVLGLLVLFIFFRPSKG